MADNANDVKLSKEKLRETILRLKRRLEECDRVIKRCRSDKLKLSAEQHRDAVVESLKSFEDALNKGG